MSAAAVPYLADVVPGLQGRGVLFAPPADRADIGRALSGAGFTVREIDGTGIVGRRQALPALAAALHLPGAADRNLDALLDTLRDLPVLWPRSARMALLWRAAEQFIEGEPALWDEVCAVLGQATDELRTAGFAFETVAFVDAYDVPSGLLKVPHDRGPVP